EDWWFNEILTNLYSRNTPQNVFPLFLTYNTFLSSDGTESNGCCIIGYHDAEPQPGNSNNIDTYAWSSYVDPGIFSSAYIRDINAISHEFAEWMNDPFGTNFVPNWSVAGEPQYGCSNVLEVGDPLVGFGFSITTAYGTFHPQDIAFFSWFARQSPSIGVDGRYTFIATYTTYSSSC
ncbi:MAG TPA: hypothetical protein VKQ36_07310, partial [Ktedonobacterales bacterium]|nr:hypothetical protein [Ktedonobacterales bacterium]